MTDNKQQQRPQAGADQQRPGQQPQKNQPGQNPSSPDYSNPDKQNQR